MLQICPPRGLAATVILAGSILTAGCSSSPRVEFLTPAQAAVEEILTVGDLVDITIDDPDAVSTWAVRTGSEQDVVVIRVSGNPAILGALRARVLLPGGVLVAQLAPPVGPQFGVALSGRAAAWTLELSLGERGSAPVRLRLEVLRPEAPGAKVGPSCADALRARGITAWVMSPAGPPGAGGFVFSGLGSVPLTASPAGGLASARQSDVAVPVLRVPATTALRGDFAGLGCVPGRVQLNVWDTGRGKPPVMSIWDASGRRLCGGAGQPACPTNPTPRRWVAWTLGSEGIRSLSIEGDELYLSSIVIQ